MSYPIGVTKGLQTWSFQGNTVERVTDNASYDNVHPDDTLLLAGPARGTGGVVQAAPGPGMTLLAIGFCQSFNWTSTASVQPMMAIGSGRSFYMRGKSQTQWQMSRPMMNGRNLLRALYHNAVAANVPVENFDDKPSLGRTDAYFMNLDSELFYVPFGMAMIMRSKAHALISAAYFELCMIGSWGGGFTAGGSNVLEAVSGLCDRVIPFAPSDQGAREGVPRPTLDAMLGLTAATPPVATDRERVSSFDDSDLSQRWVPSR